MDIYEIRQALKMKSLYDIPMRVTYYARVSSESDEQLNSLQNQIQYYQDYISKNPAWTFVKGYIDEGISGASTKHRENFNLMISDAKDHMFDLIITKEISRFARNTLDSIQFTRELLGYGVGVFFQNDNINTLDEDSELRLAIMSSIAQDELRKLSSRVRFGHQQAIKNSVVLGNSRIFGYNKENGKLVIDEKQAQMVRELFQLYASDQYSMKQIENIFWEKGYRNYNGNKISHTTMSEVIANPKYKGYYVGNKVKIVDLFSKKQKFLPPEEWVMFKDTTGDIVPAIVSEEIWDAANKVLKRRSDDVKYRRGICNHPNIFTGKIICASCQEPYYRKSATNKDGSKCSKWVCSGKIKNGKSSCCSFTIYEDELKEILFNIFRENSKNIDEIINKYIEYYKQTTSSKKTEKEIAKLESKVATIQKKKNKLLDLFTEESISKDYFKEMTNQCISEEAEIQKELDQLKSNLKNKDKFQETIHKIKEVLKKASEDCADGIITKQFVETFIDTIYVTPVDANTMKLNVKLITGESIEKQIGKRKKYGGDLKVVWESSSKRCVPYGTFTFQRINRRMPDHYHSCTYITSIVLDFV